MLHRTVAPDLAAEAQRVRELKAQGKNPDGTPYVHLPGQNAPPPVVSDCFLSSVAHSVANSAGNDHQAMKRNPETGEM